MASCTLFFWLSSLLVTVTHSCVATYTSDFPAYNIGTTTVATTTTTTPPCPSGWMLNGMYCYLKVSTASPSQDASQMACQMLGANLASIHSDNERIFVGSLCGSTGPSCHIGGKETGACPNSAGMPGANCWMWIDGTTWDYTGMWAPGEPNGMSPTPICIVMRTASFAVVDSLCVYSCPYICKMEAML